MGQRHTYNVFFFAFWKISKFTQNLMMAKKNPKHLPNKYITFWLDTVFCRHHHQVQQTKIWTRTKKKNEAQKKKRKNFENCEIFHFITKPQFHNDSFLSFSFFLFVIFSCVFALLKRVSMLAAISSYVNVKLTNAHPFGYSKTHVSTSLEQKGIREKEKSAEICRRWTFHYRCWFKPDFHLVKFILFFLLVFPRDRTHASLAGFHYAQTRGPSSIFFSHFK